MTKPSISFLAPPKYLKFIKKPITAKILFVGKRYITKSTVASCCEFEVKASATSILINAGSNQGVRKNLLFLLVDAGDNFSQVIKITRINKNSSQAVVLRELDEKGKENYNGEIYDRTSESYNKIPFPPIRVGMKVTTSPLTD
jgi:cell shape-determining protein MreC